MSSFKAMQPFCQLLEELSTRCNIFFELHPNEIDLDKTVCNINVTSPLKNGSKKFCGLCYDNNIYWDLYSSESKTLVGVREPGEIVFWPKPERSVSVAVYNCLNPYRGSM